MTYCGILCCVLLGITLGLLGVWIMDSLFYREPRRKLRELTEELRKINKELVEEATKRELIEEEKKDGKLEK